MNPDRLTALLASGAGHERAASPACPEEHLIAGYVDGGLDETVRAGIEAHLADCGRCLELVGLICRERRSAESEVPQQRAWRQTPWWAAAAAIVLAVPFVLHFSRNADPSGREREVLAAPAVRTFASETDVLRVLSPLHGSATDARLLAFRWTEVPGSPFYDVRIVTDAGDVVIQDRVTGTSWRLPAQLELHAGAEYFVHVDAYPSGDKAVSSSHVLFKVTE